MRKIKFRAWTGTKMEYNVMVGFLGAFYVEGIDPKDSACMSQFNTLYGSQVPVMQFTGLKDKNGKEIYEGDVIGHKAVGVVEFNPYFGFRLRWDGATRRVRREETNDGMPANLGSVGSPWEVIGNIYENPELIKP